MNIFEAITAVKQGKTCSTKIGKVTYTLFRRIVGTVGQPETRREALGVQRREGKRITSCVELSPLAMCQDWKLCKFDKTKDP